MKHLLLSVLLLCTAVFAFSVDFGLLADQQFEAGNTRFEYNPVFIPWISWNGNNGLSLYFSGLLSLKYNVSFDGVAGGWDSPVLVPELSRFSLSYQETGFYITAGRIPYSDALGMTASGLFDGLKIEKSLPVGSISAAALYTGLLYKKTAEILMTTEDASSYFETWDFNNFENYFASKRLMASLRYDMPLAEYHTLTFEALVQHDRNRKKESLHSQYGAVLLELYPQGKAGLIIGALFESMQIESIEKDDVFNIAFGAMARLKADVPGSLNDGINITMRFGSGSWNDTFASFTPVTSPAQGKIFPNSISGLGMISVDYTALLHRTVRAEAALRYFMRTYDDPAADGLFYGGEVWAAIAWQPFNELRLLLEGGAFFPKLGNIDSNNETLWKAGAGLILSF